MGLLSRAAGGARIALRDLEHFDPIDGAIPWDLRGVSLSDATVRRALKRGKVRSDAFDHANDWTGADHAARIAALIQQGWDDPIRLAIDDGGDPYIVDGYHRLAAARLRGDKDIAYWVDF